MQWWQVWVARSHLFPFPILNLLLTAAIKHPASTVGENNGNLWMAVGLPLSRAEGSQSQLETPLLRRGVSTPQRIGKALIGGSTAAPRAWSPFGKPGKSELLFHHWGGERRGKRRREGGEKPEGKRKEETGRLWGAGRPAGTGTASPQPRLKTKGAPATFQWKISGDSPDVPRDGYLTPMTNHKRQRSLFCISLSGIEEMKQRGRMMRSSVMRTPTPQLICVEKPIPKPSLPSTLLYFWMVGGGLPPPFFSVSSLGLFSLL